MNSLSGELSEGAYISLPREILQQMVDSGEVVYNEEDSCYIFLKYDKHNRSILSSTVPRPLFFKSSCAKLPSDYVK
jgi:hypothetical protein